MKQVVSAVVSKIKDTVQGKAPLSSKRSSKWPTVRKNHLIAHPECAVCGGTAVLEVHHIKPFHLDPALELDPSNLITLCEASKNGIVCHLAVGHLGSYKSFNQNVVADAAAWRDKLTTRPSSLEE